MNKEERRILKEIKQEENILRLNREIFNLESVLDNYEKKINSDISIAEKSILLDNRTKLIDSLNSLYKLRGAYNLVKPINRSIDCFKPTIKMIDKLSSPKPIKELKIKKINKKVDKYFKKATIVERYLFNNLYGETFPNQVNI